MTDSKDMQGDCLEQVAAYVGHRAWRDLCALKEKMKEAEQALMFDIHYDGGRHMLSVEWAQDYVSQCQSAVERALRLVREAAKIPGGAS